LQQLLEDIRAKKIDGICGLLGRPADPFAGGVHVRSRPGNRTYAV
jgi:hypothetical protein